MGIPELEEEKRNGKGAVESFEEEGEESEEVEGEEKSDKEISEAKKNRTRMVQIFSLNQYMSSVSVFKVSSGE